MSEVVKCIFIPNTTIWRKNWKNARKLVVIVSKFGSAPCFFFTFHCFQQSFFCLFHLQNTLHNGITKEAGSGPALRRTAGSESAKNECWSTALCSTVGTLGVACRLSIILADRASWVSMSGISGNILPMWLCILRITTTTSGKGATSSTSTTSTVNITGTGGL